jgi:hypothetical protein
MCFKTTFVYLQSFVGVGKERKTKTLQNGNHPVHIQQSPTHKNPPRLREQTSDPWFYDTSTGAATGAARCGSFAGKAFSLFSYSLWMNAVDMMIYVVRAT